MPGPKGRADFAQRMLGLNVKFQDGLRCLPTHFVRRGRRNGWGTRWMIEKVESEIRSESRQETTADSSFTTPKLLPANKDPFAGAPEVRLGPRSLRMTMHLWCELKVQSGSPAAVAVARASAIAVAGPSAIAFRFLCHRPMGVCGWRRRRIADPL